MKDNNPNIVALILGNGFDIANNFKTGYCDFIESDYFKLLLDKNNSLATHIYSVKQLYNWVDVEIEIGNYSSTLEKVLLLQSSERPRTSFSRNIQI